MKLVWEDRQLEFELEKQKYRVGRGTTNEIQIPDQLVSSKHAVITDGYILDEGSTNGTFLNEEQIPFKVKQKLKPGDVLMFGDTTIKVAEGKPYGKEDDDGSDSENAQTNGGAKDASDPLQWHPSRANNNTLTSTETRPEAGNGALSIEQKRDYENKISTLTRRLQEKKSTNLKRKKEVKDMERRLQSQILDLQHQIYYAHETDEDRQKNFKVKFEEAEKTIAALNSQVGELKRDIEVKEKIAKGHMALLENASLGGSTKGDSGNPNFDELTKKIVETQQIIEKSITDQQRGIAKLARAGLLAVAVMVLSVLVNLLRLSAHSEDALYR